MNFDQNVVGFKLGNLSLAKHQISVGPNLLLYLVGIVDNIFHVSDLWVRILPRNGRKRHSVREGVKSQGGRQVVYICRPKYEFDQKSCI